MRDESRGMSGGFSLVEMLVVIGIITILMGVSIGGYSAMTKAAEKAKAAELVKSVETALTAYYQDHKGVWPRILISNAGKQLDARTAYALVRDGGRYFDLSNDGGKLIGLDRFGILTPWGAAALKRAGRNGTADTKVGNQTTVKDHVLYYALDLDGDGVIKDNEAPDVLDAARGIRATAAVWCIGKSGGDGGKPRKFSIGLHKDDIYSWTLGQTKGIE